MRLKYFLSAAMLSALFAACSDDIGNGNNEQPEGEGKSYVNIAINLPTVNGAGTRADGDPDQSNDQFDDGEASEYKVNSAYLVIFRSTETDNESTAQVELVKQLNLSWSPTDGNVTTFSKTIQEIPLAKADNLWALVVLNDPNAGNTTAGANQTRFTRGKKFSELTTKAGMLPEVNEANGIYMTNAPLYKDNKVSTLVKIRKTQMFDTKEAAEATAPLEIFVERGYAKVTVSQPKTSHEITLGSDKYVATIKNWELDITNTSTYPIRNVSKFDEWKNLKSNKPEVPDECRFYGDEKYNRIYWAIDPNYDNIAVTNPIPENAFNELNKKGDNQDPENPSALITKEISDIAYCYENTFNVANQLRDRTTRVVFKVAFAPQKEDGTAGTATDFYTIGSSGAIYTKDLMRKAIIAKAVEIIDGKNDGTKYQISDESSVSKQPGTNKIAVGDIAYQNTEGGTYENLTQAEIDKLNEAIGAISYYKNGECYYVARIKHFGDTYTPWSSGDPTYGETNAATKEQANKNWLGRYGVLRNNWYELQVTGIKLLGNPNIPEPPTTPDDEEKFYINVKVNIHAWAKRVQNVEL